MSLSEPFVRRAVATTLLTIGVAIAGAIAFKLLPVSPLPEVDYPTISVSASLPGASPETMAATVATPLERALGRIAGVTEITSTSSLSNTRITLQFDLNRDIDGAARDVQAALNAAVSLLPTGMPSLPRYRKVNPADAPIIIISLTSDTYDRGKMYDAASTILAEPLSQVQGVGNVQVGGSSLPAVRVELNPRALNKYAIGIEDVRTAVNATNANRPKGTLEEGDRNWQIYANDQAKQASEYRPLIIAYRNGAPVRLSDVADVVDSMQDVRNAGISNGKPAVLVILYKQPGANVVETADRVRDLLPLLKASLPGAIDLNVVMDRTGTIRASLRDVERVLAVSMGLVILVVFLFLRDPRATLIPSVAVPVSLIGTFAAMYLCGFSLNNLSLMALTIATGFVADDAIVVLENVSRHIERGLTPFRAALVGVREVGFTVLSMSISLIAVFIPILLMGGIVGRLFREFAVTLSVAILVSLAVSLTTTPMMCARLLKQKLEHRHGRVFSWMLRRYEVSLAGALRHPVIVMAVLGATIGLNGYLYWHIPKGFFPQQDTGRLIGTIRADQSISFQAMRQKLDAFNGIVKSDPAVESATGFTGGGQRNRAFMFITLKPRSERNVSADQVVARLRKPLSQIAGAQLFMFAPQDIRAGGRQSSAQYQFTLQSDDLALLRSWAPRLERALHDVTEVADVSTDQDDKGLQTTLVIDRQTAARMGVSTRQIDATLNDSFGQAVVSTIYSGINQYRVVLEVAPEYWQSPEALKDIYVRANPIRNTTASGSGFTTVGKASSATVTTSGNTTATTSGCITVTVNGCATATTSTGGSASNAAAATLANAVSMSPETLVPLSAFAHYEPTNTPLAVNHQGQFVAATLTFNLPIGVSLSDAVHAINDTMVRIGMPESIRGTFQGTARAFQSSLESQPVLILTALLAVYIVLGILYESYIHPITILSTLPSAGVGALLALKLFNTEFSIMALIGVILLIGIVKKNAIMMIDFALATERNEHKTPEVAIFQACLLRFRPIMMTTMVALLGALPLALGWGEGSELRRPLGISIVGGLLLSQLLTLYTTPVVYLYMDRLRLWFERVRTGRTAVAGTR